MPEQKLGDVTVPIRPKVYPTEVGTTHMQDVQRFHDKFGISRPPVPTPLPDQNLLFFRLMFMAEELFEFAKACGVEFIYQCSVEGYDPDKVDLPAALDSLLDLEYVVDGTADLMGCGGLTWERAWAEVQRANMSKVRAASAEDSLASTGRGHALDVIKPPGFQPPDIAGVVDAARPGWNDPNSLYVGGDLNWEQEEDPRAPGPTVDGHDAHFGPSTGMIGR